MRQRESMHRVRTGVELLALVLVTTACTSGAPTSERSSVHATVAATSAGSGVPNPFTVVERWPASELGLHDPQHFAIGPDGNLYVTEIVNRVSVISPHGNVLDRWGETGDGPGQFSFERDDPSDVNARIAVGADGSVYVSDSGNSRVEVLSPSGRFIRQFGSFGARDGQFLALGDISVGRDGSVYAADDQTNTVSKFGADGRFQWEIGGPGTDLIEPHLGAVDAHDRLVMLNGGGTVFFVNEHGTYAKFVKARGCDVSVDALGDVYVNRDVLSCDPGLTQVFDRAGRLIGEWSGPDDTLTSPILFGPNGDGFAITRWTPQGRGAEIVRLRVSLPGAEP